MAYNAHHVLHRDLNAPVADDASSTSESPPSSSSSPRSSHEPLRDAAILDFFDAAARPSSEDLDRESAGGFASSNSDSYDSSGEGTTGARNRHFSHFSGDEGSYSSRVSSRATSPVPTDHWAYHPEQLASRSLSRNRSRNHSGATTPISGYDKEGQYGADCTSRALSRLLRRPPLTLSHADYHSHHYQTSALLRKLTGSLTPETLPVLQHKRKNPGWWKSRAERRRRASSDASHNPSLLGTSSSLASTSKSGRHRSCLATFGSALLRQPLIPTQPLTILFSLLLLGCFAATVTTFLVHVLSTDKLPIEWRKACQEQRPFPHALADSLAPVNVFVGVFSVDAAFERRQLIRTTYVAHTKAIDPATGRPAPNVQVKFILGRPEKRYARRVALEMELYDDLVVLDLKENMNRGKTHAYFKWAHDNATVPINYRLRGDGTPEEVGVGFKKADYVVKADDDSFIRLNELERNLRITPREKTYWGCKLSCPFVPCSSVANLSAAQTSYDSASWPANPTPSQPTLSSTSPRTNPSSPTLPAPRTSVSPSG